MSPLTIYLGKLLGLYCIVVALAMMANKRSTISAINALIRNDAILLVVDFITVGIGLALVVGHDVWTGGALPVVVTLVGWASLIKGLVFLALSPERMVRLYDALHYEKRFYILMSITLALGLYLTIAAFGVG